MDWLEMAARWGLSLTPAQADRLQELAEWLAARAPGVGLSRYSDAEEVAERALSPTLAVGALPVQTGDGTALDLGPGSGALGFCLAVVFPGLQVVLADRRQRVVSFLRLTQARLGLENCRVEQVEAEDLAKSSAESFDLVCYRALAPAREALQLVARLPQPQGTVMAWHRTGDRGYIEPPEPWELLGTVVTNLPELSASQLRLRRGSSAGPLPGGA